MLNGNGHTNGHAQKGNPAVTGDAADALRTLVPGALLSRSDISDVITAAKANVMQFIGDPEKAKALVTVLMAVANDPNSRQRVRAAEVLLKAINAATDQGIKLAEIGDKASRLDKGTPTENGVVKVEVVHVNRLSHDRD